MLKGQPEEMIREFSKIIYTQSIILINVFSLSRETGCFALSTPEPIFRRKIGSGAAGGGFRRGAAVRFPLLNHVILSVKFLAGLHISRYMQKTHSYIFTE